MKGRKAIPDAIKVLRGTDQKCRMSGGKDNVEKITDVEQILSTDKMKLLPTKRSKKIFMEKANQLIGLRVLTILDIEQLAIYANSLDILFSCMKAMRLPPEEVRNKIGYLTGYVQRPEISLYKQMVEIVNKIGADFGFTPMSRQRINREMHEEKDELDDLIGI